MGGAGRRRRRWHAPRRCRGRPHQHGVRRRQGRLARGAGVGGGALPPTEVARPVTRDRRRLRRARHGHDDSAGRAIRVDRRADRHEDVLEFAAAQPRRPDGAHSHDADQSQREAQALLARRGDARAVRTTMRRGCRRSGGSEAGRGPRQVRTEVREGARGTRRGPGQGRGAERAGEGRGGTMG